MNTYSDIYIYLHRKKKLIRIQNFFSSVLSFRTTTKTKQTTKISFLYGQTFNKQVNKTNAVRRISNKCKNRFVCFFFWIINKEENNNNIYPSKPKTSKSGLISAWDLYEPENVK
jgi:plasmid replication initiation protein